jgi:hypothetical protein
VDPVDSDPEHCLEERGAARENDILEENLRDDQDNRSTNLWKKMRFREIEKKDEVLNT